MAPRIQHSPQPVISMRAVTSSTLGRKHGAQVRLAIVADPEK